MSAKYEFVPGDTITIAPGRTLKRIRALATIAVAGVAPGNLGGYVESETNLAQVYGDAQVSGNAQVYGDAWVYGDAQVSGNARVSGNAWVYGDAQVSGNARVTGDAQVSGNAWVSGDARVYGNARVTGDAQVYGNAQVSPICVTGLKYPVTIIDQRMMIGCEFHLISEWREFDDRRIAQMDGLSASRFWRTHRKTLLAICDAERPNGAEASQ